MTSIWQSTSVALCITFVKLCWKPESKWKLLRTRIPPCFQPKRMYL